MTLTSTDGETGGKFLLGPLNLGECSSSRCPALGVLKLRPFLAPWSPAVSCELFCPAEPLALTCIDDGLPPSRGRLVLSPLTPGQWPSARCSGPGELKLRPFLAPWSPALSYDGEPRERFTLGQVSLDQCPLVSVSSPWCTEAQALPGTLSPALSFVSSSAQVGPLALTGIASSSVQVGPLALTSIDGEPRGRLALGPMSLGVCLSAMCPAPGALKLRSFLAPWCPALSCVSSPAKVGPMALTGIGEWHEWVPWKTASLKTCRSDHGSGSKEFLQPHAGQLPDETLCMVSSSAQKGPLALTCIDGEPGGRHVLGLQAPGMCLSASFSAPSVLKLGPFPVPWSPALSCDGETRGRLALGLLFLGQCPSARCPSLCCAEAQALPGTLVSCTKLCELFCTGGTCGLKWHTGGEPGGRLVLGLQAQGQCPSAWCSSLGVLKLGPSLEPWSPALSCVSSSTRAGPLVLTCTGEWILLMSRAMSQAIWGHQGSAYGIRGFPEGASPHFHERGMRFPEEQLLL
ncbi:uncharacterized protein LOC116537719 [Sapajus apella]|uniref:Uncharacterized protein LOC116537719 n=1 Tax=Sapajus apella TaxID=9515 RepID=A0A6J3GEP6_SAPAP|nr:uncharacterized protein LOC116537719 [Sapajus apella]